MMNGFENKTNDELLLLYGKTKRHDIKNELVLRYVPLIKSVAIQMKNVFLSFTQIDDIINEGVLTLMSAIDRYDPALKIKFETYVSKRIRGMIIDLARKQDIIPRSVRKQVKTIDNVTSQLYNRNGVMPSEEEVAKKCQISLEKYREYTKNRLLFNVLSLDLLMNNDESNNNTAIQVETDDFDTIPEDKILHGELKSMLKKAIKQLNEKEQIVISLYYVDELNMKDIARVLDVSEPRISQIHSKALFKLKEKLKEYLNY